MTGTIGVDKASYVRLQADTNGDGAIAGRQEKKLAKKAAREFDTLDQRRDGVIDQLDVAPVNEAHLAGALPRPEERALRRAVDGLARLSTSGPQSDLAVSVEGREELTALTDPHRRKQAADLVVQFRAALAPRAFAEVAAKNAAGVYHLDLGKLDRIEGRFQLAFSLPLTTLDDDPRLAKAMVKRLTKVTVVDSNRVEKESPVVCRRVRNQLRIDIAEASRGLWATDAMKLRFHLADGTSLLREVRMPQQARIDGSDLARWEITAGLEAHREAVARCEARCRTLEADPQTTAEERKVAAELLASERAWLAEQQEKLARVESRAVRRDF